jgi:hypothetical protein
VSDFYEFDFAYRFCEAVASLEMRFSLALEMMLRILK